VVFEKVVRAQTPYSSKTLLPKEQGLIYLLNNASCYLEVERHQKTSFCREFEKKSVQISEIRGKGFRFLGMVAAWVK
jgi:hypothetical protein